MKGEKMKRVIEKVRTSKEKICALLTSLVIVLEMFSPYGILIDEVKAAVTDDNPYFKLSIEKIDASGDPDDWDDATSNYYYDFDSSTDTVDTYSGTRLITLDVLIENCKKFTNLNAENISLIYDSSVLEPIVEVNVGTKKKPVYELQTPESIDDWAENMRFETSVPTQSLDVDEHKFTLAGGTTNKITDDEVAVATLTFKLAKGKTLSDITKKTFTLASDDVDGLELVGTASGEEQQEVSGSQYLVYGDGFSSSDKLVSGISLKTAPTKTQYYTGETLDFTGGVITVTYDDSSTEDITITDAITKGTLTASSTVATTSKSVTLTYGGKTTTFDYYLLDSIAVGSNLTKMSYEHGDTIDFAGGTLIATYKNSAGNTSTQTLNIADGISNGDITVDKTKADVDNKTLTFTYHEKTTTMDLTVTDPVESISVTTPPTTLTYNDGDTISLAGGVITPITKSGKTGTAVATDDSSVTASTTTSSIAKVTNKWTIPGGDGLQAGNQTITLTYEGKTADITIVVNDTVSSVSITTQPTAKNKYGTTSSALSFDGIVATVQTSGGASFTIGESSLTIDRSSYNANSLAKQSFPVKYGTVSSSNNAELTLSNYITGISVNFADTEFNYGTSLSDAIANATYTENYADGTSSSAKAITSDMVTGYTASPASTLFDSDHTYSENLTIKLSSSSNKFDQLPATAAQTIKIKDYVDSISVANKPSKITYKYGEEFLNNGGKIQINYKSGATSTLSMGNSAVTLTESDGSAINMSPNASELTNGKLEKPIKVTYSDGTNTFTTSFNIKILDDVSSIAVSTSPTKTTFEHGDTFNADGGKLTVTFASGTTETIDLDEATLTETDDSTINMSPDATAYTNNTLTKNIKVTYAGVTTTYDITINNTVGSISVTAPTKVKYNLNEATDLTGGKVTITRKAGNTEDVDLSASSVTVSDFDTSVAGTNKTANVKYTENSKDYTGTFTYTVIDNVTNIAITAPTDVNFNHGDTLTFNGGNIKVTYASGTTQDVAITSDMVTESGSAVNMSPADSDYVDNKVTKTLTITYTEDGVTQTQNYTITIKNNVTGIKMLTNPTKVKYNLNDTKYDLTNGEIAIERATGVATPLSLSDSKIILTSLSTLTTTGGDKDVTVTYTEDGKAYTTTFKINVKNGIVKAEITEPTKTEYDHGDTLDLTGGKIVLTKADGTTEDVSLENSMVTESGSSVNMTPNVSEYTDNKVTKTLTISYTPDEWTTAVTKTYTITINNSVEKVEVTAPTKVSYNLNEATDLTGGKVTITRKAGNTEDVDLSASSVTVSDFDTSVAGTNKTANVKYTENSKDYTGTFTYDVIDKVSSIAISGTQKTDYEIGDTMESTQIEITRESGATETIPVTDDMVSGFDTTTEGTKTVTITYGGQSTSYQINVTDAVQGITVKTTPTKTEYKVGEILDVTGGTITITKKSGATETKNITPDMISGFDSSKEEIGQVLTVTYEGFTTSYNVDIKDYATSTTIVVPTKTKYNYGDTLDLTDGKIVTTWASGKADTEEPITESMVTKADGTAVNMKPTSFDSTNKAQETLKITANGETKEYTIEITNDIKSISIKDAPKSNYNYGDTIDTSTGSIEVTRANGDKETVSLSDSRITTTGFDTSIAKENIPVTVKFTENGITKETNYTINVKDDVSSITLVGTPKTDYKYNESLDLTGLTLTVTRPSGTTPNIAVANSMVSGYNPEKLGTQTVTITYGGKTATFSVDVKDYLKDIELVKPNKVNYKLNESLDLTGASITEVMASGAKTTGIPVTNNMVSPLDSSTEGNKTLTVTYTKDGKTFTKQFAVVITNALKGITVKSFPVDEYLYGKELDLTGAKLEVETESGDKQEIPIKKDMVKGYVSKPTSDKFNDDDEYIQTIEITYTKDGVTKRTTYPVTTKDYFDKIKIQGLKTDYTYGEQLDLDNATVSKVSASGRVTDTVSITKDMVSGYDSKKEGTQVLTIKYSGKEANKTVNVKDNVLAISMNKNPDKITYSYGSNINLVGAKLNVVKNSGTKVIEITEDMISGYNPEKSGVQTITVTYEGKTTEFAVTVESKPETPEEPENPTTPSKDNTNTEEPENPTTPSKDNTNTEDSNPVTPTERRSIRKVSTTTTNTESEETVSEGEETEEQPTEETKNEVTENTTNNKQQTTNTAKSENTEKQTATLGAKDRKPDQTKTLASLVGLLALFMLIILLIAKNKNVRIYVEDGENDFKLIGKEKISGNDNEELDLSEYLKEYPENKIYVVLEKSLSKKLDNKKIKVILPNNKTKNIKVEYDNEEYITEISRKNK